MAAHIRVIDSHTGGESTRIIVEGGPDLGTGALHERLRRFRENFDFIRSAVVNEPRGNDAIVGALLCEPLDASCCAGVIFFNNVGYLNMCGHGTIGLAATLAHMGKIAPGLHRIETPVGVVEALLHNANEVTVTNVASFRHASNVVVNVPGVGLVTGDVAWGGNWFFLTYDCPHPIHLSRIEELTNYASKIREAIEQAGITGKDRGLIDHIEIFGPADPAKADGKNFVLCPGRAYDRSPCGTGTSAKLACLYEDGRLTPGKLWRQESVIGSVFEGTIRVEDRRVYPSIRGAAYVNAEADLILNSEDPFVYGIREHLP